MDLIASLRQRAPQWLGLLAGACLCTPVWAALTITPITWNVIGLDSNSAATGPYQFPVAARVCAVGSASNGPVTASFEFIPFTPLPSGSANGDTSCGGGPCITLRGGTLSSLNLGSLAAGQCADAYFEVEVQRVNAAYGTARRYVVRADDSDPGSITTPQPRELFVERLISQNRNAVLDVSYSAPLSLGSPFPTPLASMSSVNAGGSFGLAVGNFYDIRLDASTATQGYEQLETFANFSNAVFRIHRVQSTYSADSSPNVASPSDLLYGDGCTWQLSPALPNYLGCLATGKVGGTISTTYRIEILQVAGGTTSALNTLIYDYSGSSFHYNADVGVGGRTIVISNPATAAFSKSFSPATIPENGISRLTLLITNPNLSSFSNYNFVDPLPAGVVVAATPNASTSGCGTPTFAPAAAATSLSFSNGTIVGGGTCSISVDVTGANSGVYNNVTNNLFVGTTNTGLTASATLTISDVAPPPSGTCTSGVVETLAVWDMSNNTAGALASPYGPAPPVTDNVIGTPVARYIGFDASTEATVSATGFTNNSWLVGGNNGGVDVWPQVLPAAPVAIGARYFEIELNTSEHINIDLSYRVNYLANGDWGSNGSQSSRVYSTFDGGAYGTTPIRTDATLNKNTWNGPLTYRAPTSGLSTTRFGMVFGGNGSGAGSDDADVLLDDIVVTGCRVLRPLTVTKSFSPTTIGIGQSSTLTFVISNPNTAPATITGVSISDPLPAGLTLGTLTNTSCGGTLTQSPVGTISLTGGSIAASGSCTFTAQVTGTTAGLKQNVSNPVSSTQTGPNTGASGIARANLLVLAPPTISKLFTPDPIVAGGTSNLVFTVSNPNSAEGLVGVGFTDTFPVAPGAMVVAATPAAVNNCGGTWTTTAGAGVVSLSGATLAAGASCTLSVRVTAPVAGTYNNTSGPVSHVLNAQTLNGNTASDSLVANAPQPRIGLQKRISTGAAGPWGEFSSLALNGNVYYQFTIENLGDVPLSRPASGFWINDPAIPGGPFCGAGSPAVLPIANVNDTHIYECVIGPIVANQQNLTNTATAVGDPDVPAVQDGDEVSDTDTAAYTTKLPDLLVSKTRVLPATPTIDFTVVNDITYRVTVQNLGPPVTVNDTLAPIVLEDTFRAGITYLSFAGADANWSCSLVQTAPLHKVQCVYSGVLASGSSTFVDLNVQVAINTPDINNIAVALNGGDPACNDPNETPDTDCKGPYQESTVPVTLSDVSVRVEGGQLLVDFGTAAEAGTLGYRVLTDNRIGSRARLLSEALTMASGSSLSAQRYQIRGAYNGETSIWIEEVAVDGVATRYGPYPVGASTGDRNISVSTDWRAIAAEQSAFRVVQARGITSRSTGSSVEAELKVASRGWVRVRHEDLLAQGIDWSGIAPQSLSLHRGSRPVPLRYSGPASFGAGSEIAFLGEPVEGSLYTRTAVYRLRQGSGGAQLEVVHANPARNSAVTSIADRFLHAPSRGYDLGSPAVDPWWARRAVRNNTASAVVSETFELPEKAPAASGEQIKVRLWGGLNYRETPDHSVRVSLNGSLLGSARFDGLVEHTIEALIPPGVLQSGSNTLSLELVGDTGLATDVVYLDSIEISYQRQLRAQDNRLSFGSVGTGVANTGDAIFADNFSTEGVAGCSASDPACQTFEISGLTRSDVQVLRTRANGSTERLGAVQIQAVGNGFNLRFATRAQNDDRYDIEPMAATASALIAPVLPVSDPLLAAGTQAEFLIVTHPSFADRLAPLVSARRAEGLSVGVVDVEGIYRYYNQGVVDPVAIDVALADARSRLGTRYVLLVGGDTYDYLNHLGSGSQSFIPTHYQPTGAYVRHAPVDAPYADVDSDGRADLAVGRFPVRSAAELDAVIAKTLSYRQAAHAGKLLRVSDRDQASISFDGQSSTIGAILGSGWTQSVVALRNYPSGSQGIQAARADIANAVNSGQALVSFFGHSSPSNWTRESLLTAPLVYGGLFNNAAMPTVIWQLGCYGAYFVDPNLNTIAHGLMLQSNGGGAAAILGATGLTEVSSDLAWMGALAPRLRSERIGDAWRQAQRDLAANGPNQRDISVGGVLLGDPTMRIRQ